MKGFLDNIRRVTPYTPGEQPSGKVIKLNTNECPYPPSPKVVEALKNMDHERLRLYPEIACESLTAALADYYGIKQAQIFAGVGSDDVLSMCFLTFFAGKKPILFPDITYSFYDVWADAFRIPYQQIPLTDSFEIRAEDYRIPNGGIIFPNPNAPTGIALSKEAIRSILQANQHVVVIVDEAYSDFSRQAPLRLELAKHPNLIVLNTMSKAWGLAAIRMGMAFASKEIIALFNKVKYPYNVNLLTQRQALESLKSRADVEQWVSILLQERSRLMEAFRQLPQCKEVYPSDANFFLARMTDAQKIYDYLVDQGIIVRNRSRIQLCQNCLRITIGTRTENSELVGALRNL